MNLSGSIRNLKSFIKPGLIALIPVFLGCDAAEDTGTEFNLDTNIDVSQVEFDFPSTNVFLDSLRTDGESRAMVGSYDDALVGNIRAEGYFQYRYSGGTLPVMQNSLSAQDTLRFDSLYLELEPVDILPYTQSGLLSFEIVELTDTLQAGIVYLSNKSEEFDRVIGSFEKNVNMEDDTLYTIRMDDVFGQELYNRVVSVAKDADQVISSYQFKDLGLVPTMNSEALSIISTSSANTRMKLYMSGNADSVYVAAFSTPGPNYSHVQSDKSASPFSAIVEDTNFDLPDGRTVIDPLSGLTTTFSIDNVRTFFEDNPRILINTAIIDFGNENFVSRDTLNSFRLHFRKNGGIFGPGIAQNPFSNVVMSDDGYISAQSLPSLAFFNSDTEQYSLSSTLFFQALYNNYRRLLDEGKPGELIYIDPFESDTIRVSELVLISPFEVTLQQTIFKDSGVKLRIFYTEVN